MQIENEIEVLHKKTFYKFIKIGKINSISIGKSSFLTSYLTTLWFSGITDGFTNLLIRGLREKRQQLTMYFKLEYQEFVCDIRLTCSRLKYILTGGF